MRGSLNQQRLINNLWRLLLVMKKLLFILLVVCWVLLAVYFALDADKTKLIFPSVAISIATALFFYIKKDL